MKEHWSISKEKLVSLEEGLPRDGETSYVKPVTEKSNGCKQLILCVKFFLYLELLLFVGWACYTIWQTYRVESMEVKIRDDIHEAELHNPPDHQLTPETSTISADNLLEQMENLLHAENALSKVNNFENRPENDEIDVVAKTTKDYNSEIKEAEKSDVEELSSLLDTNIPKLIKVEVEEVELKENDSDSLEPREDVLVWHFGILPFPNIYNIKDRSQSVTSDRERSDKSENFETTEEPSEIDSDSNTESEQVDSNNAADLLTQSALLLLLQGAEDSALASDMISDRQNPTLNDRFTVMCEDNKPTTSSSQSETESDSYDYKNDSDMYDDYVAENSDELKEIAALLSFDEHNEESTKTIGSPFINSYGEEDFTSKPFLNSWLVPRSLEERHLDDLLPLPSPPNLDISLTEFDPSELTEADLLSTGSLNKRSNPEITPVDHRASEMSMENTEEIFSESLIPEIVNEQVENDDASRLQQQLREFINNQKRNNGHQTYTSFDHTWS